MKHRVFLVRWSAYCWNWHFSNWNLTNRWMLIAWHSFRNFFAIICLVCCYEMNLGHSIFDGHKMNAIVFDNNPVAICSHWTKLIRNLICFALVQWIFSMTIHFITAFDGMYLIVNYVLNITENLLTLYIFSRALHLTPTEINKIRALEMIEYAIVAI